MPASEPHLRMLEIAAAAISPYNTQPWRFRIDDDGVDVFIIRTKNFFLKLQGVSHMTLGCVLENLIEGAKHVGFRARFSFLGGTLGLDDPCARVALNRDDTVKGHDVTHIVERCTNRKLYRQTPLKEEVGSRIRELTSDPNVTAFFSTGTDRDVLAKSLARLESVRLSNFRMTREALEYVRFTEAEMAAKPDGLDLRSLEFDRRIVRFLKPIQRRRVHRVLRLAGAVRTAAARHRDQLIHSAGILTFAIKDKKPESFVRLGMIIQRTLNELSREGVQSMSVLSGLYLLDVMNSNPEIFSRRQIRTLRHSREQLERLFDRPEGDIVFIVRVGYGDPPSVFQSRRPVEDLIVD